MDSQGPVYQDDPFPKEAPTKDDRDPAERDLGFGSIVAGESRQRLLNRDGSFNVERQGLGVLRRLSVYHALLAMSWPRFFALVTLLYGGVNTLFACVYLACGSQALSGPPGEPLGRGFWRCFYFSVETVSTIGYGNVSPVNPAAHAVMTVESLVGILGFAVVTGLAFARFARPQMKILFSDKALIAPYRGGEGFMFRIANARQNELIEVRAQVLFSRLEAREGGRRRRFDLLPLERQRIAFFPLTWTVVHPIDEDSPLWGLEPEDLYVRDAEFLILLTGIDETFSETVHARSSYKPREIVWNARFASVFNLPKDGGQLTVDLRRLSEFDLVGSDGSNA